MSDEAGLLAAIRDNLADDTARLVYADWLQENGEDDRAEFIRVECERGGTQEQRREEELAERAAKLLRKHKKAWMGPLARRGVVKDYESRSGFVSGLELSAAQFARHAEAIFAHHPMIESVFLTAGGPWKACFSRPEWKWVRKLMMEDNVMTPVGLRRLVELPHTTGLRDVSFGFNYLGTVGALILREWDTLPALEHLSFLDCDIGDRGAEAILNALRGSRIKRLGLGGNELSDVAAVHLEYADLPGLTELHLFNNWLTKNGAQYIAAGKLATGLTELNLHSNPIGNEGADALIASRHLTKLRVLRLMGCGVGRAAATRLRKRFGRGVVTVSFA